MGERVDSGIDVAYRELVTVENTKREVAAEMQPSIEALSVEIEELKRRLERLEQRRTWMEAGNDGVENHI